jgi:hypothetical protein
MSEMPSDRSRPKGGQLGQRFFGRFVARFLNFSLSRATAALLGSPRLRIWETLPRLTKLCGSTASRVRRSSGVCFEWYSKTEYEQRINLGNSSRFLAVAVKKLRGELEQQGGSDQPSPIPLQRLPGCIAPRRAERHGRACSHECWVSISSEDLGRLAPIRPVATSPMGRPIYYL